MTAEPISARLDRIERAILDLESKVNDCNDALARLDAALPVDIREIKGDLIDLQRLEVTPDRITIAASKALLALRYHLSTQEQSRDRKQPLNQAWQQLNETLQESP